jgi:N6-adenosine-specific RNA methylase IME4
VSVSAAILEMPTSHIRIGKRYRKEMGDLHALAQSIEEIGLLHPIVVTSDGLLVVGERRLRAYRDILKRQSIPVRVIDVASIVRGEHDENEVRENFRLTERVAIADAVAAEILAQGERRGRPKKEEPTSPQQPTPAAPVSASVPTKAGETEIEPNNIPEKVPEIKSGEETRRTAALAAGFGNETTYRQAKKVVDKGTPELQQAMDAGLVAPKVAATLADATPEKQRAIVARVNEGAKPVEAARQVRREELAETVAALPAGKHRVIYADPPWQYGDSRAGLADYSGSAAEAQYPTMNVEELCKLDVKAMAADNAVLFCWATFPLLTDALEVVRAWGFKYKTALVWDKIRPNLGNYHDASAELLLVCTRGSCTPDVDERVDQVQTIERGRHSEKPEEFRRLIDKLYVHGPRIELFRRGAVPNGWRTWGNEAAA